MDNIAPQNPNPPSVNHHQIYATSHLPSHYYASHQHSANPSSHLPVEPLNKTHDPVSGVDQSLRPPGVDPNSSAGSLAPSHGGVHEAYDPSVVFAQTEYYQDPNVAMSLKKWAMDVLQYYGSNPNLTGVTMPTINPSIRPYGSSTRNKGVKKTKIIQSVWCEVCKVECNTKEVLDKHKEGKKHKKNVAAAAAPPPPVASGVVSVNPVIGPEENPAAASAVQKKKKKKASEPVEDLETKRRRILEEGAASNAVRVCTVCSVVCNSDLVFAYHNAGKKHASMMLKQRVSGQGVATQGLATQGVATAN